MDLLDRLLGHDEWTTGEILRRCGELTVSQIRERFDIGYETIHETLVHMIGNVRVWTDLMASGSTDGATSTWRDLDLTGLVDAHRSAYAGFADLARRIRAEGRFNETWLDRLDDPPAPKTFGGAILHVITHNMHHRGELLHMLDRLGIRDLPEGDLLGWEAETSPQKGVMTT